MAASAPAFRGSLRAIFWIVVAAAGLASCGGGGGGGGSDDDDDDVFGLETRPSNPACLAPERPVTDAVVATADAFPDAPAFSQPTKIIQAPDDPARWFVLEKSGRIKTFLASNPSSVATWLDYSAVVNDNNEGGMLGLAFHPDYPFTREVFLSYTTGDPMESRVSRVILDDVGEPEDTTEQVILTVDQPFENHNGGDIAFGPDGNLYIGFGDGGSFNDPFNYGQDDTRLLGKMLRIDVTGVAFPSPGYVIPNDNPFAGNARCGPAANGAACPEIYATGLRNPWRWSFDEPTGDLWLGDVGQGAREEVNRIEKGGNYGWDCREGFTGGPSNCSTAGLIDPVSDYSHGDGNNSITGGYVYRGDDLPALVGRYVFADFGSGRIWALEDDGAGGYSNDQLVDTPYNISAFALDADGELYFADYSNGRIRRLVAQGGQIGDLVPNDLADTGCVDASDPSRPASGLIPYTVNAPFWSDGAGKERYLALPNGTRIDRTGAGDFNFPARSVLLKTFRLGDRLVETRLLMRHPDGVWAGYTYEWNESQTAATRVTGGKTRAVAGQTWIYPSEAECMQCHTAAAGFALGPEITQLNGSFRYPSTGITANQLATLEHINLFSASLPGEPDTLLKLADPADEGASTDSRARAWLETNCANCHRPGGPTPSGMDLRATTTLGATNTCDVAPQSGDLGIGEARLIAPGDPGRSVLLARINRRDANGMPPVGSSEIDSDGVALLTGWISSLGACP